MRTQACPNLSVLAIALGVTAVACGGKTAEGGAALPGASAGTGGSPGTGGSAGASPGTNTGAGTGGSPGAGAAAGVGGSQGESSAAGVGGSLGPGGSQGTATGIGGGATPAITLLDDMEAPGMPGSYGILAPFVGGWFMYDDGTIKAGMPGAMMLTEDKLMPPHTTYGTTRSTQALHVTGGAFTDYGSGFGTSLISETTTDDLSPYTGISFWAKSSRGAVLSLKMATPVTDPRGGTCVKAGMPGSTAETKCDDDFYVPVRTTTEWTRFDFAFKDFVQEGWGAHPPDNKFDPSKVYAIKFAEAAGTAFDVWIDDIAFTK